MAKIALTAGVAAGFAAAGFFTGGLAWTAFTPMEGLIGGASLGMATGAAIFLRPHIPGQAPLQDLNVSSSANGAPIPFGYGWGRIPGQVIWSPGIGYSVAKDSSKGALSTAQKSYVYHASFAAAFCEGPARIQRIWADSKLIYSNGQAFGSYAPWNSTTHYQIDDLTSYSWNPGTGTLTQIFQCTLANSNVAPPGNSLYWQLSGFSFWDSTVQYEPGNEVAYPGKDSDTSPRSGAIYACIKPSTNDRPDSSFDHWRQISAYYAAPTIYGGDETQEPDPLIQGSQGVTATPAFRGICYAVWETFPLANFGNRIPNVRAEVQFLGTSPSVSVLGTDAVPAATIPEMILDLCDRAGLPPSMVDVSQLTSGAVLPVSNPYGYVIERPMRASSAIQEIMKAFFIDACESSRTSGSASARSLITAFSDDFNRANGPLGSNWTLLPPTGIRVHGTAVVSGNQLVATESSTPPATENWLTYAAALDLDQWAQVTYISGDGGLIDLRVDPTTNNAWELQMDPFNYPSPTKWAMYDLCGYYLVDSDMPGVLPCPHPPTSGDVIFFGAQGSTFTVTFNGTVLYSGPMLVNIAGAPTNPVLPSVASTCGTCNPVWYAGLRFVDSSGTVDNFSCGTYSSDGGGGTTPSGASLVFVPRGRTATPLILPESDLGLEADKAELTEQLAQEQDLPQSLTTEFIDYEINYQQGKQIKARNPRIVTLQTRNAVLQNLPFSLTADQARQIAEAGLYSAWQERMAYSFNLWRASYALLDPTDLVEITYEGDPYLIRLNSVNLGQGGTLAVEAVHTDLATYDSTVSGAKSLGFQPTPPRSLAVTLLWLFDLPLLRDEDSNPSGTGYYAAMGTSSKSWTGAVLYDSGDGANFNQVDTLDTPATFGSAVNILAAPRSPWTWDTVNTLTVQMGTGSLAGDSDLNVLNGSNALIVGGEVIQFADAVENPDGTYTVSRLLRGRRGTEDSCGSHVAGETVLAPIDGGFLREQEPLGVIGQTRFYRAVTTGQNISDVGSETFTDTGNDLKPYAPVGIGGLVDSAGNIIVTWQRRTRIGGAWVDGIGTVALSEQSELYALDVMKAGAVARTYGPLSTPTCVYPVADQTADFGGPVASVTVNVYQLSSAVGRGFPGTGVAPSPGGWPVPWPPVFPPSNGLYYVNSG